MPRNARPRWVPGVALIFVALLVGISSASVGASAAASHVPRYDHVFVIVMENNGFGQIIGNRYAPTLNALARDYGLATNYHGVADPSEPNYVAMLGGSSFGITNDNPYWFHGNTVNASNLMSQLNGAGESWRGYFQGMPYPGYRGYCYPDKCNGIPDADTQYVAKHNGVVNFANLQTPAEFANMVPFGQLTRDLATRSVANLSYIVPDECHDMHGAPPWCVDSGVAGTLQQDWLIAEGDGFVHDTVSTIMASKVWGTGLNAIVVTFDEGNQASSRIATIVIVNHGPRGVTDNTYYDHYALLRTLEGAFGVGCLLNSCNASTMSPLFAAGTSSTTPTLPHTFAFPTGHDTVSPEGFGRSAAPASLTNRTNWTLEPSVTFGVQDNVLASVAAAGPSDVWAVGSFYPSSAAGVLATLGEHFDGTRWTAYPLPDVGTEENTLLSVTMPGTGDAWAVGYYISGNFEQRTLIEHFNGTTWSVFASPSPSGSENILYGVAAVSTTDVWAVGAEVDSAGVWQTLAEHWNGTRWSVVATTNPGKSGDQLYGVTAIARNDVVAVGQQAGNGFPSGGLIERWDGKHWSGVSAPSDPAANALPLGVAGTGRALTVVGQQETDLSGYTPYVVSGNLSALAMLTVPSATHGENDLFGVTLLGNGSAWAVGWAIYNAPNALHVPLILHEMNGVWTVVASPSFARGSDSGLASVVTVPGGGTWAVGDSSSPTGSYSTLIEYHS